MVSPKIPILEGVAFRVRWPVSWIALDRHVLCHTDQQHTTLLPELGPSTGIELDLK